MKNYLVDETSQGAAEGLADQAEDPQDRLQDLRVGDLLGDPVLAEGLGTVKANGSHEKTSVNSQTTHLNKQILLLYSMLSRPESPLSLSSYSFINQSKWLQMNHYSQLVDKFYVAEIYKQLLHLRLCVAVTTDVDLQVI